MTGQIAKETLFLHNAEMGLGAWAWGDRLMWHYGQGYTDNDIQAAFQTSLEAGVNLVDTAESYGAGRSERLLGQFIKATDKPVVVATKFMPFPWRLSKRALINALRRSLERLGLEHIDLYQIHWPFPPFPVEYWVEGLAEAFKARLTHAVGVSNFDKSQTQRAYNVLAGHDIPLASNQVEYHLLDRTIEKNGLLERCQELNVRLIAYSPLAKGLLTGKYTPDKLPPGIRGRRAAGILGRIIPLLQLMTEIGQEHGGKTPGQVALNWIICKGALPIPGAKNASQASQNTGAAGWRLTPEQVKALDEASDQFAR
jgi:aryl-alcohol dehydrogenase-like predicted oxidoreductase